MRLFILAFFLLSHQTISGEIDVEEFYRVFSSGTLTDVNLCIRNLVSAHPTSQINAYKGAMLMKKAGFEKAPKAKLNAFKSGHALLEFEISKTPDNPEFHFLRLVIEESAPGILKYNRNLQEDRNCVIKGYNKLEPFLRNRINLYCKHSKVLTITDLQ